MAYNKNENFPFIGIDFTGKKHLLKEVNGDMGLLYNGKWKHFVSINDNLYWTKKVHYNADCCNEKKTISNKHTLCGRDNRSIYLHVTSDKNEVDCPDCIEKMKTMYYYCEEHGFLNEENVTFDEKCDYCGKSALANER